MYEKTVKLQDNERVLILEGDTGVIRELKNAIKKVDNGKELFNKSVPFHKRFHDVEPFLLDRLNAIEYKTVGFMANMAQFGTNSLAPLDDDASTATLSDYFKVDRRVVLKVLKKLYDLGVYGKFSVSEVDAPFKKYWILNPYISYRCKVIDSDIKNLFKNTEIAKYALTHQKK